MCIFDNSGRALPWDGEASGALKVRGPWVAKGYYGLTDVPGDEGCPVDKNGWFDTGDVASISPDGFLKITDRTKDVIKSGGEWISSIEIENAAVNHEDVMQFLRRLKSSVYFEGLDLVKQQQALNEDFGFPYVTFEFQGLLNYDPSGYAALE